MSSLQRRAEKKAEREAEDRARWIEESRKASLCLDARIDEADASNDVKDILRIIAERAGVDLYA